VKFRFLPARLTFLTGPIRSGRTGSNSSEDEESVRAEAKMTVRVRRVAGRRLQGEGEVFAYVQCFSNWFLVTRSSDQEL